MERLGVVQALIYKKRPRVCMMHTIPRAFLCMYTKCELLATFYLKTIDMLATLCYNAIMEREGKPKGNPREQNGGNDYEKDHQRQGV